MSFHHRHSVRYHRLNGSSSPVLTATSRSYGKAKNMTPHRIETPNLIDIKFGTVDYVGKMTPGAKFHAHPFMEGFSANIRKIFNYIHIPFFRNSLTGQTPRRISTRWRKRHGLTQGCAFWGAKKFEINI